MRFYLFNPEHDMALANFSPYYKTATEIIRMRNDLSALPCWYAERGGLVLVADDDYRTAFEQQCATCGLEPYGNSLTEGAFSGALVNDVKGSISTSFFSLLSPWGWDPALVQRITHMCEDYVATGVSFRAATDGANHVASDAGCHVASDASCHDASDAGHHDASDAGRDTADCLMAFPSAESLQRIRTLSGRQQCVRVLADFADLHDTCGEAVICSTLDEVRKFLQTHDDVILKAPWSGSGRGLTRTSLSTWTANLEGWVARILRTQGNIMAEPIYNKVEDFAMEFYMSDTHQLSFAGYSLFETDSHGNYKENVLCSDARIVERLTQYVSIDLLEQVRQQLLVSLADLLGTDYVGYFGVDMMICRNAAATEPVHADAVGASSYWIHPCVEINLRMNMGVVARLLYDRYFSEGSEGSYVVEHYTSDGEAQQFDAEMRAEHPLKVVNGRLAEGYFSLTPVRRTTRYQCYVVGSR